LLTERLVVLLSERRLLVLPMVNTRLRNARLARGWTQEQTADRAKIGRTTYIRLEQGTQQPHESTMKLLCEIFGLSPQELGFSEDYAGKANRSWSIKWFRKQR
jgi:transcriptional regulator with XRE-family HTH domain